MTRKVVRLMTGTEDLSVRCVLSLLFEEEADAQNIAEVLGAAAGQALARFKDGPHEEAVQ